MKQPTQRYRTVAGERLRQTPSGWETLDGRFGFELVPDGWAMKDRFFHGLIPEAKFHLSDAVRAAQDRRDGK